MFSVVLTSISMHYTRTTRATGVAKKSGCLQAV